MSNFMYDLAHKAKANANPNTNYNVSNIESLISEYLQCNFYCESYVEDTERLQSYGIAQTYCTDSYVGVCCVFLDDELLAITKQDGRKCDEDYYFVTEEMSQKFLNFLKEIRTKYEEETDLLNHMWDLDLKDFEHLKEGYFQVDYVSNILSNIYKDAYLKTDVDYIKCDSYKKANDSYICQDLLVVVDGREIEVHLSNVYFKCEGT